MKSVGVALAMAWGVAAGDVPPANYAMLWRDFRNKYPKVYTIGEEEHRFKIFIDNVDKIYAENAKGHSHQFGMTEFADMTSEEFNAIYVGGYNPGLRSKNLQSVPFPNITGPIPDDTDWVTKGGVTPVKNQQRCGSCWAFSTTGSVEGAYFVASGQLESLSEEDLVQCDTESDKGCQGGLMDNAFTFIQQNGGICSESSYPYSSGAGVTGTCKKGCQPVVTVSGHVDVPPKDEDALKKAVSQQPVSVAIEADKQAFQLYAGGVLDNALCGTNLDHGVLIVGYGTDNGKDYWKVKNSWGPTWGEKGYIRMARGKNMCGIATQPSYPTGAKKAAPAPPAPPSPPTPPSPPPSPSASHYEDPKNGCKSDEVSISIQGVQGAVCAPSCGLFHQCPKDLPSGVTARPQCALQDSSTHKHYCALICQPSKSNSTNDDQCGTNASCKNVQQGIGLCTYDDDAKMTASLDAEFSFGLTSLLGSIVV